LADYLKYEIRSKDIILDIGTGCGIQAIIAATLKEDVQVIATDINPIACKCAKTNAVLNNVNEKIEFISAALFQPLLKKKRFSLIIFNPPYLPLTKYQKKNDWISLSWTQGIGKNDVVANFLSKCHKYLKGRILMILSTLSHFDVKKWEHTYSIEKLSESAFFFEKIILVKITKDPKL